MKKLKEVIEVTDEGLMALMGKRVTFYCINYIYTGDLVGVNDTCILLDNPAIVYETGSHSSKEWVQAESLPNSLYIQVSAIESFGIMK